MNDAGKRVGRAIEAFIENPVTILVKGLLLFFIGLSEASRTFHEDLIHKQVRVGHGLILIGLFSILERCRTCSEASKRARNTSSSASRSAAQGSDGERDAPVPPDVAGD